MCLAPVLLMHMQHSVHTMQQYHAMVLISGPLYTSCIVSMYCIAYMFRMTSGVHVM